MDGIGAAWAAYNVYGLNAEYLPSYHDQARPDVTGRDVLILDFSYKRHIITEMANAAKSLLVIDHHESAQKDLAGIPFCTFDMNRSGAGMAWDILNPGKPRPWHIEYIEDRDLWRHKLDNTYEISAWLHFQEVRTVQEYEERIATTKLSFDNIINHGSVILDVRNEYVSDTMEQIQETSLDGIGPVPGINAAFFCKSELLGKMCVGRKFALLWCVQKDGRFCYSLRSDENGMNVVDIAVKFGGGGHKRSAGFTSDTRVDIPMTR